MKRKLHLGNGVYLSMFRGTKKSKTKALIIYQIVLDFYDITGSIAKKEIYYCDTYIDALYLYNSLRDEYFSLF